MKHPSCALLVLKPLWSLPWDVNEGEVCVFVCDQAHTHTHTQIHKLLCYFKSINFLPLSAAPLPLLPFQDMAGVLSRVTGIDGGRARA